MKWGIIMLAIILIVGTMLDLYMSLAVRTFYLTLLHYPDILENQPAKEEKAPRSEKYQTPKKGEKEQNMT